MDYAAVRKNERQISLEQLAEQIRSANAAEKDALPWLKLARFGNATTEHGSLRHDRNVISVTGCEVDYDGEQVGLDAAIEALEKAGVQAIAYTTPSYRPEAPRWRVLCPFSRDLAPPLRAKMVNRLNGLLKGVANSESWTLSQSYYFGRVNGNPDHRVELIDGLPLDELDELDLIAIGKPAGVKGGNGAAQPATGGPIDETALRNAILHGENYHLACVRLVGNGHTTVSRFSTPSANFTLCSMAYSRPSAMRAGNSAAATCPASSLTYTAKRPKSGMSADKGQPCRATRKGKTIRIHRAKPLARDLGGKVTGRGPMRIMMSHKFTSSAVMDCLWKKSNGCGRAGWRAASFTYSRAAKAPGNRRSSSTLWRD
jgi:hypothetical protein